MKPLICWIDVVSPYAWLAFERLPQALEGCSYAVEYRPVLFAGLLAHWGQKGPAEIEPKRAWTFRQVHWLAAQHGIALDTPAVHPFNPLALLRLALASGPNRRVMEAVLRHVWIGGGDPNDAQRLAALRAELQPAADPGAPEVKAALRANTEAALAAGVFGVPGFTLEGRFFWGLDSLPMLRAALLGDPWFDGADDAAARPPTQGGVVRTA
jgi:2-hydroxychromene-2-carboxylate isomerase